MDKDDKKKDLSKQGFGAIVLDVDALQEETPVAEKNTIISEVDFEEIKSAANKALAAMEEELPEDSIEEVLEIEPLELEEKRENVQTEALDVQDTSDEDDESNINQEAEGKKKSVLDALTLEIPEESVSSKENEESFVDNTVDIFDEVNDEPLQIGNPQEFKKLKRKKLLIRCGILLGILMGMYFTVVYSEIPFIAKWRTIYIETAMGTNSHQWLATLFFPKSVIDKVMAQRQIDLDAQDDLNSTWEGEEIDLAAKALEEDFYAVYWELDSPSFKKYMEEHKGMVSKGYDSLLIEDLDGKLGLKTAKNDAVLVVDTANNLLIIGVKGDGYQGKMAIVKDPKQVILEKSQALGSYGELIDNYGKRLDGIVAMNASAFKDVDGVGSGGDVKGSLIIDGVEYGHPHGEDWKFFGMKQDYRMYVTAYSPEITSSYRWAVEFFPALVVDGKSVVDGTYGMGIQPRSAIGQARNGDFLLLVVDGRQVGYSLGCTVADCTDIMMRYNVYQASNLDGGSSSVLWYKDRQITKSCSVSGNGRYSPDAFVVKKPEK